MTEREIIIFYFTLTLMVMSCAPKRQLPFGSFSLSPLTEKGLIEKIKTTENSATYTQISKFTAEYIGINEQSHFKGFVRIAQDSLLMLSISPIVGGEAMRLLLSPDSSKTINRIMSSYKATSNSPENQIIPLSYQKFQALLNYRFSDLISNDYSLSIQDKMYCLEDKKQKSTYTALHIDGEHMVRRFYHKDFTQNTSVLVVYNTFSENANKRFPQDVELTIQHRSETAILRLSIKRVEFKEKLSFPFKVPSRYGRAGG